MEYSGVLHYFSRTAKVKIPKRPRVWSVLSPTERCVWKLSCVNSLEIINASLAFHICAKL